MTMNKKELNNEIILCRASVRKAKVIVIRKIIKNMKILKSCKIETLKEKKLKKAERLYKKIQMMKKVKDDDVTKFALRNSNLESYLHGPKVPLKKNILACLAKHEAVARKVNSIRERIPNWEIELPILLDSLGKKKKLANKHNGVKGTDKAAKQNDKKKKFETNLVKVTSKKPDVYQTETLVKPEVKTSKNFSDNSKVEREHRVKYRDDSTAKTISSDNEKPEKIDDPFFIDKKVIQPKLLLEDLLVRNSDTEKEKLKGRSGSSMFHRKPFKIKDSLPFRAPKAKSQPAEDQLHPSWAAKKVTLIKPFEGKKIIFSEE